jgi:hypothetical protein
VTATLQVAEPLVPVKTPVYEVDCVGETDWEPERETDPMVGVMVPVVALVLVQFKVALSPV